MPPVRNGETGSLWVVDLSDPIGHEQGYRRPALIVSDRRMNHFRLTMICPLTRTRRDWPVHIEVSPGAETGLRDTSYIQVEQLRTLSHERLVVRLGSVDAVTLLRVQAVLGTLLALPVAPAPGS